MKTKLFLSVLFAAFLSVTGVKASNGDVSTGVEVRNELVKAVDKLFIEGNVVVRFSINEENKVSVFAVNGTSSELEKEVAKRLNNYTLGTDKKVAGIYAISFKFVDADSYEARLLASK
jgi:3-phosphoglycerate kinase